MDSTTPNPWASDSSDFVPVDLPPATTVPSGATAAAVPDYVPPAHHAPRWPPTRPGRPREMMAGRRGRFRHAATARADEGAPRRLRPRPGLSLAAVVVLSLLAAFFALGQRRAAVARGRARRRRHGHRHPVRRQRRRPALRRRLRRRRRHPRRAGHPARRGRADSRRGHARSTPGWSGPTATRPTSVPAHGLHLRWARRARAGACCAGWASPVATGAIRLPGPPVAPLPRSASASAPRSCSRSASSPPRSSRSRLRCDVERRVDDGVESVRPCGHRGDGVAAGLAGGLPLGDRRAQLLVVGRGASAGGAPATTSVISPRVPPSAAASSASGAAADLLVGLGQLAADRGRPVRAERRGQVGERGGDPVRRLEEDQRALLGGERASRARRSPPACAAGSPRSRTGRRAARTAPARWSPRSGPGAPVTGEPGVQRGRAPAGSRGRRRWACRRR